MTRPDPSKATHWTTRVKETRRTCQRAKERRRKHGTPVTLRERCSTEDIVSASREKSALVRCWSSFLEGMASNTLPSDRLCARSAAARPAMDLGSPLQNGGLGQSWVHFLLSPTCVPFSGVGEQVQLPGHVKTWVVLALIGLGEHKCHPPTTGSQV